MPSPARLVPSPRPAALCGHCGGLLARDWLDAADRRRGLRPGDVAVCRSCAGVLVLDAALRPVAATEAELAELRDHFPEVSRELGEVVLFVRADLARRGPPPPPPEGNA